MATDSQVRHYRQQAAFAAAQRSYDAQSEPDTGDYEDALESAWEEAWTIPETIMDALGNVVAMSQQPTTFHRRLIDGNLLASDCTGDELLVALFNGTERQALSALHELRERMDALISEDVASDLECDQ